MAKPQKVVSPAGKAIYPRVNQPDTGFDANGTFHTKLEMDSDVPVTAKFLAQIDRWHEASLEEMREALATKYPKLSTAGIEKKVKSGDKPYTYVEDEETGEETNIVRINFKMKHRVPNRKKEGEFYVFTPVFVDSTGALIRGPKPLVYGGSTLKVRFTPILWNTEKLGAGVQLRMDAVQIIELVEGGAENAEGFGDEGGGYTAPEAPAGGFADETVEAGAVPAEGDDDGDF